MQQLANASARESTNSVAGLRRPLDHLAAANPGTDRNIRQGYGHEAQLRVTKKVIILVGLAPFGCAHEPAAVSQPAGQRVNYPRRYFTTASARLRTCSF